jgi:tRNA(fMet)-specific endonuclease VapC
MYLFDTNIISYLFKGGELGQNVSTNMNLKGSYITTNFYISSVTYMEILCGIQKAKAKNGDAYKKIEFENIMKFMDNEVKVIQFGVGIAKKCVKIKTQLEVRGISIDMPDLIIGSSAVDMGYILVTNNTKDFKNIPNLSIEDWTKLD